MSFFEANKIVAALLTASVVALGSGFVSELLFAEGESEERAYEIAAVSESDEAATTAEKAEEESSAPQVTLASLLTGADPAAGEKIAKKCKGCHTLNDGGANKVGPNLYGVLGRGIASIDGFKYSDALKAKSGEAWGYDNLNAFMTSPKTWVPGTKMTFSGVKKEGDRAALLAYLRQQNANPPPLPE
jgi:cytochrome c